MAKVSTRQEAPYYVWRRGDGYVGCTRNEPRGHSKGEFTILLVTDDWPEARALIEKERSDPDYANPEKDW